MTPAGQGGSSAPAARRRRGCRLGAAPLLAVLGCVLASRATAETSVRRSLEYCVENGSAPAEFRLDLTLPLDATAEIRLADLRAAAEAAVSEPDAVDVPPPRKRRPFWIGVVTVAAIGGSAANSFTDSPTGSWKFTNEQWFGRHTYAGGADKVSHFVAYNWVSRLLTQAYSDLGVPRGRDSVYGGVVSAAAGLMTEIGDGTNKYGFSYEDLVSDVAGAATAIVTARYGLDDLLGFRTGYIPHPDVVGQPNGGTGKDYTEEIYTADIKIAGLARRMNFRPGLARFLLFSTTFGAKGYPYARPETRERQVGLEVGLHITEVLRALGMPTTHWWQRFLYVILDSVRIPYTQFGIQYDLNHKEWRGPGIGDDFKKVKF